MRWVALALLVAFLAVEPLLNPRAPAAGRGASAGAAGEGTGGPHEGDPAAVAAEPPLPEKEAAVPKEELLESDGSGDAAAASVGEVPGPSAARLPIGLSAAAVFVRYCVA